MSAEFATLAEVLQEHPIQDGGNHCGGCDWRAWTRDGASNGSWEEHVESVWREACTIRTVEQLDLLPAGSAIRELDHPVPGVFELQELDETDEPATGWYVVGDGMPADPRLPALLLAHPDWSVQ